MSEDVEMLGSRTMRMLKNHGDDGSGNEDEDSDRDDNDESDMEERALLVTCL